MILKYSLYNIWSRFFSILWRFCKTLSSSNHLIKLKIKKLQLVDYFQNWKKWTIFIVMKCICCEIAGAKFANLSSTNHNTYIYHSNRISLQKKNNECCSVSNSRIMKVSTPKMRLFFASLAYIQLLWLTVNC